MDSEEGRQHLMTQGLLLPGEWETMVAGDRHTTCFWWISLCAVRLYREGVYPAEFATRITLAISSIRAQANDLMSSLDRDKPIPYVAMCGLLVKMNVLIFTSWKGVQWSIWLHSIGQPVWGESRFWVDVLCLFMWNISYSALYDLGYVLHNPFEDRRVDVAHEVIFGGINKLSKELADGHLHLPPHLAKKAPLLADKAGLY